MSDDKTKGKQWVRVSGPNLHPWNKERCDRNKAVKNSEHFIKACENVGIPPTKRQASKWSNKKGKAYLNK